MGKCFRQDFDRDDSIEAGITGFVHLAHATRTDSGEDLVRPRRLPGRIGMGSRHLRIGSV